MRKDNKPKLDDFTITITNFAIRIAEKENATPAELAAMTEIAKLIYANRILAF